MGVLKDQLVSRICLIALRFQLFIAFTQRKRRTVHDMAIGNGELMHESFPKHVYSTWEQQ